ncbi:MAG: P-type conjugative transfer ATPase TrbB [Proteobacteria bacterium]|nr:MAG: P-type conjugative transfer ATPase TrbB [Pseudomonadota bacterium]
MISEHDVKIVKEKIKREMGEKAFAALLDADVFEIMVNPNGALWIAKHGSEAEFVEMRSMTSTETLINTVASYHNRTINHDTPILETEFPYDGSRFSAVVPPVVEGPSYCIRKPAAKVFSLDEYVQNEIMTQTQADFIKRGVVEKKNIIVIGGTGSGKTTLTNSILDSISEQCPHDRLLIMEDTREIQCRPGNIVKMRSLAHVTMNQLLALTLRYNPDRIIVGEVRGGEALTIIKGWNTGHPGGIATLHANDALAGLKRLEQLISEVSTSPMQNLIAEMIDIVIVISRSSKGRKITEIAEVDDKYDEKNGYQLTFLR